MTNVLIADDHTLIRSALSAFLKNLISGAIVDEVADGEAAYEKIRGNEYSLIILDINMPKTDSFKLVSGILALRPKARILMYSMNREEVFAKRYLKLGAMGYLAKTASQDELKKAITSVLNNKRYISSSLAESFLDDSFTNKQGNPFDRLSKREFQIAQLMIKGKAISEISTLLNLKASTITGYKNRILEKLGVNNLIEFARLAQVYNIE